MPNQPHDVLGRRIAQTRENNITETYAYDLTGQLTGVDYGTGRTEGFAYDPAGNRVSSVDVGGVPPAQSNVGAPRITDYTANALNQYTQAGGVTFAYDVNGNLIDDGKQHYAYDAQNRLISVESVPVGGALRPDSVRAEFFYDAGNRCVLRKYYTVGSQGQWILNTAGSRALTYDTRWNLLAERTLTGTQAGRYIHGIRTDEILQWTGTDGAKLCPLADGLGSTVALSDQQGRVTERFRYDAFGTPTVLNADYSLLTTHSSRLSGYRLLFTGREWLALFGLNEHRNRYYAPMIGRWLQTDPIKLVGGLNINAYAFNSPANFTDWSGLACCQTWSYYFNECMSANGMPVPSGIFETTGAVSGLVATITGAISTLGADATMAEILLTAPSGLAFAADAAVLVGGVTASYYAGVLLGCSAHAAGERIGDIFICP